MFGKNDTRHIDLHLPQSWNHCTTDELEAIAAAIIQEQQRVDRYHPFDWSRVKLNVVLAINNLTPDPSPKGEGSEDQGWLVRRPQDKEPWPISTGQLVALTERIAWIDDEKSDKTVFMFPYPELRLVNGSWLKVNGSDGGSKLSTLHSTLSTIIGPAPLLDGYTWREYRWLTDWMQEYMRCANALAQSKTEDVRRKNQAALDTARNEFLAVLFKPTTSALSPQPSDIFEDFSPVKWQVILFWWSSLMAQLAKKFPKVFKPQPVGKHRRPQKADTPWDFYNRVTATIQKYIGGLSSSDVDNQPYGVTLQQLEMMADEAAELERAKSRHP